MKKISDAAKAAAVMQFVSDSGGSTELTPERAVELFDELGSTFGPVDDVLENYDCTRWAAYDGWPDDEYWESIEVLAHIIDQMFDHFEFPPKQI